MYLLFREQRSKCCEARRSRMGAYIEVIPTTLRDTASRRLGCRFRNLPASRTLVSVGVFTFQDKRKHDEARLALNMRNKNVVVRPLFFDNKDF